MTIYGVSSERCAFENLSLLFGVCVFGMYLWLVLVN